MPEHTLITTAWNIVALANRLEHFEILHGTPSHRTAHRYGPTRSVRMIGWFSNRHGYTANRVHPMRARTMHHWSASMEYSENKSPASARAQKYRTNIIDRFRAFTSERNFFRFCHSQIHDSTHPPLSNDRNAREAFPTTITCPR